MVILFEDQLIQTQNVWIDLIIKVKLDDNHIQEKTVPALVDTGFSGGVRLPLELENDRIMFLQPAGVVSSLTHKGVTDNTLHPKYSLWFQIIDQNGQKVDAGSWYVYFDGLKYAVIGMDFILDSQGLFAVNGETNTFSLSIE